MYYRQTYVSVASARAALSQSLRRMGFSLRDVNYEIKRINGQNRYHPVVSIDNGKRLTAAIAAKGFVVTH